MPAPSADGDSRLDVHDLQMRANKITDESLDSTRRMLQLCEESQDTGARTLQMLDHQGEQLDRVEEGMDQINADMKEAEKNLTGMEKCCGLCVLPCSRQSEFKDESKAWNKNNEDGKVVNQQPSGGNRLSDRNGMQTSGYVAKITNDAREDEMEDNLGQVGQMVGNLRNMAIDMGSEITSQNRQIDRINLKGEANEARIQAANERAVKILKN